MIYIIPSIRTVFFAAVSFQRKAMVSFQFMFVYRFFRKLAKIATFRPSRLACIFRLLLSVSDRPILTYKSTFYSMQEPEFR